MSTEAGEAVPRDDDPSGDTAAGDDGRRPRRTVLAIALTVGVVVLGLVGVLATRPSASTRSVDSPLLGQPVPAVTATTLTGEEIDLADQGERWVLVNFFATWCVPCRQEHDDLIRFHDRHAELGDASVVGVIYDDSASSVRQFLAAEGGSWPMLVDPNGRIALEFGVSGVPESFLVSPDGIIVAKIVGGVAWDRLESLLIQLRSTPAG